MVSRKVSTVPLSYVESSRVNGRPVDVGKHAFDKAQVARSKTLAWYTHELARPIPL